MSSGRSSHPFAGSTRRSFLGLGGALTLALAGAGSATAGSATAGSATVVAPVRGCPTGKDPVGPAARPPSSRLAAATVADRSDPPVVDQANSRFCDSPYLSRAQWGADESFRFDAAGTEVWVPAYRPVQVFTVHHTADGSTNPDNAARVRSIYRNQAIGQNYGDIGYQFFIDAAGVIYEGRYSGTDGLPGFDATGSVVTAAHVYQYNSANVGIALLGDFTSVLPTDLAYGTLVRLLATLTAWQGVDPLGQVNYVNPDSGRTATVPAIAGHRDWAATQCPGNTFAPTLGRLRTDVAAAQPV